MEFEQQSFCIRIGTFRILLLGILLSVREQLLEVREHTDLCTMPYRLLLPLHLGHGILQDGLEAKLAQNLPQNGYALPVRHAKCIARVAVVPEIRTMRLASIGKRHDPA